jgi:hypothetical protein
MYSTAFDTSVFGNAGNIDRVVRTENNSLLSLNNNKRTTSLNIPGFAHDKHAAYTKILKNYN